MASPLSLKRPNALNVAAPPSAKTRRCETYEVKSSTTKSQSTYDSEHNMESENDTTPSSPFVSRIKEEENDNGDNNTNPENALPNKNRHSRILSGHELSPLKILSSKGDHPESEVLSPERPGSASSTTRSPRTASPQRRARFPVRVNTGPSPLKQAIQESEVTSEDALRDNEGLTKAIKILEGNDTTLDNAADEADATSISTDEDPRMGEHDERVDPNDISTFSTFSAVPNMTMFAQLGHSPARSADMGMTPSAVSRGRPEPSPSRTTRPPAMHESGDTSNLLMDFTEQINGFSRYSQQSPSRNARLSPARPNRASMAAATPLRQQSNLLDFDIPPMPTPRSMPTITPRELESLKSGFLSEISSLKASLSGKEAEVASLKTAVGDAEKRVGECMEQLHQTQVMKETLAEERESWERRGHEMENVLRKVKEEIVHSQREREELEFKLDESEKRREAAEMMAQEAESKMAGMRAGKMAAAAAPADCAKCGGKSPEKARSPGGSSSSSSARDIEIAVERVARELHALYKSKHETKVAALKKSYESRWEKRVRELEGQVDELAEENERLRYSRNTRVDPAAAAAAADEELMARAVRDAAQIKELNAEIEKLDAVVASVKADNGDLRQLLERERVEKGELVQLAEEMMQMQSMQSFMQKEEQQEPEEPVPVARPARPARPMSTPVPARSQPAPENFRSSIGRASGLKAPNSVKKPTQSRIGGITHERNKNGGSHGGLPRPNSGLGRTGIMSSIEKMGSSYRGRGD
ncbi:hypothetical protein DL764_007385 [Monosporascus ibericus]|uniref:Uncharacterized protein n=1 Tax=Monosporascus ibericus TaxID=155417 RepID=A0A4Q4T2Z0_9PEZI|nr:hypothetical protein DL764_007385 [Monosporascus ibericus]